jgi:hypothetical protein
MGKKKKSYNKTPTVCPYCSLTFKTPQGMLGHHRLGWCPGLPPGKTADRSSEVADAQPGRFHLRQEPGWREEKSHWQLSLMNTIVGMTCPPEISPTLMLD